MKKGKRTILTDKRLESHDFLDFYQEKTFLVTRQNIENVLFPPSYLSCHVASSITSYDLKMILRVYERYIFKDVSDIKFSLHNFYIKSLSHTPIPSYNINAFRCNKLRERTSELQN